MISEQWPDNRDKVIDEINHLMKCFDERLTLNDPRLADHYLKSELLVLIRFRIRLIDEEFIACFQRSRGNVWFEPDESGESRRIGDVQIGERPLHLGGHVITDIKTAHLRTHGDQKAVLIHDIEPVELPEGGVSSFVWFDRVDRVDRVLPHALYLSKLAGFIFLGGVKNREIDVVERPRLTRSDQDELVGHMVKGTSQALEDFPGDHIYHRWYLAHADEVINELSRLWIALGVDYIWVGGEESLEGSIQLLDVVLGPFDLSLHALQSITASHAAPGDGSC